MTEHLSECPILKPCCGDQEFPEHGFCGNFVGGRCLHCMAECICDALRACEQRVLDAAREAVETMRDALHTHYRIGCEPPGKVDWSQHRKCDAVDDILAAIDALKEQP